MTAIRPDDRHLAKATIAGLESAPIQRKADGTIDVEFYLRRGRRERSRAFYAALKSAKGWFVHRVGSAGASNRRPAPC